MIAGLFGLCGVVWGKRLEREHWLRDRRLAAYSELVSRLDSAITEALNWNGDDDPESDTFREVVAVALRPVVMARGQVDLLGPTAVAALASEAQTAAIRVWYWRVEAEPERRDVAWEALRRFRDAARPVIGA